MVSHRPEVQTDAQMRAAVAASSFRHLPASLVADLAAGARPLRIAAGATIHREGEDASHLELVIDGLIRVHVSARDGRTMTIRYCRSGALMGAATLYAPTSRPFAIQALARSKLVRFQPDVVRAVADRDLRVTRALLTETSERVFEFVGELSASTFASVRERVGRHLLDIAADRQRDAELVVDISQQQLADAVGTVREVVVRVLRDLRGQDIIETGRSRIRILDPERLAAPSELEPRRSTGTRVPDEEPGGARASG